MSTRIGDYFDTVERLFLLSPDEVIRVGERIYGTELHIRGIVSNCYISIAFMVLQAMELGLGTAWIGFFDQDRLKALLEIPSEEAVVVSLLAVGYANEHPRPRPRKSLNEIVFQEKWRG